MDEKISNSIALHQMTINELKDLKKHVNENIDDKTKFIIETRHMIGHFDMNIFKRRNKLDISTRTMNMILDEAIKQERTRIDKLIDMEIDHRTIENRIKD